MPFGALFGCQQILCRQVTASRPEELTAPTIILNGITKARTVLCQVALDVDNGPLPALLWSIPSQKNASGCSTNVSTSTYSLKGSLC